MSTTIRRKKTAKATIDRVIGRARLAGPHAAAAGMFERLLYLVQSRTDLLCAIGAGGRDEDMGRVNIVVGLLALASHRRDWPRPADEWSPTGGGPIPRFASLARHLLSNYPLPPFMASVWPLGGEAEAKRRQGGTSTSGWAGTSGRPTSPCPSPGGWPTSSMAPDHYSVDMALRWGQVVGLGGSRSWPAGSSPRDWAGRSSTRTSRRVVDFFVNHPELGLEHIGPIVEYLHDQRFVPQEQSVEESLHGRTASAEPVDEGPDAEVTAPSGRRVAVRSWRASRIVEIRWRRSNIGEFRLPVEGDGPRFWTIHELLGSGSSTEKACMRHCARVHDELRASCARGEISIWSMRFEIAGRRHRARRSRWTWPPVPSAMLVAMATPGRTPGSGTSWNCGPGRRG